jgi:hypothetical protein
MSRSPSLPCIFCGEAYGCDCPNPADFDPTPIENALGLHLVVDQ